jgi:UDP-4-amino-4,6-dideoxy-N-acetyl-beta-L-altrosamine N-acetyltransferase
MDKAQLRPMQEHDLPIVWQWRNSPRVRQGMFSDHEILWDEHVLWFERSHERTDALNLLFEIGEIPVGVVQFTSIDRQNRRCNWGFYVGPDNAPKGTGFRMGCLALDFAFDSMGMRKICAEVLAGNVPSRNFHTKLGFSQEGYFRNHVSKNNTYHDVVFFSLEKENWLANRPVSKD